MSLSLIKEVPHQDSKFKISYFLENSMENQPHDVVGVRANLVYSQIARTGRVRNKTAERDLLIKALDNSSIKITIEGRTIKKDPLYVFMPAKDLKLCFGKRADKLPRYALIKID